MERYVFFETYMNYIDAVHVMEQMLIDRKADGWDLVETSGIQYLNGSWRLGMSFEKKFGLSGFEEILEFADKGEGDVA